MCDRMVTDIFGGLSKKMFTPQSTTIDLKETSDGIFNIENLESLEIALKTKRIGDNEIKYANEKGSFVIGKDPIPLKFSEEERADIFEVITKYGSEEILEQFLDTLFKTESLLESDSTQNKSHNSNLPNFYGLLDKGFHWNPRNLEEYEEFLDFFLDGIDPEPVDEYEHSTHGKEVRHGEFFDIQDFLFREGAHVGIMPMFTQLGLTYRNEGYGLYDDNARKPAFRFFKNGKIEVVDKETAENVLERILGDYTKLNEFFILKYGVSNPYVTQMREFWEQLKENLDSGEIYWSSEYNPIISNSLKKSIDGSAGIPAWAKIVGGAFTLAVAIAGFNYLFNNSQPEPEPDTYKPRISDLKYDPELTIDEKGYATQNVNFTATDIIDSKNTTGPIASVNVEVTYDSGESVNGTIEKVDGNFFRSMFNVTEGQSQIEVEVKDPAGNVAIQKAEFVAVKKPTPPPVNESKFVEYFVDKGYNKTIVEALSDELPRLEELMFAEKDLGYLEEIVKLTVNNGTLPIEKNAVSVIAKSVYKNLDVENPERLIANVSRVFNVLEKYSIIKPESWFVGNLTKYQGKYILPIYGEDALNKGICVIYEDPEINKNFTSRQHHVYCLLMKYNPEIAEHKLGTKAATLQVDNIVYDNNMDKPEGEEYVWLHFVQPRIAYVIQKENEGKINCLDEGDFEIERGFINPEYEMKTARLALMPIELTEIKIKTGGHTLNRLENGEENVNFDEELGKSPQEWLRDISDQHYEEKGEVYKDAIKGAFEFHPIRHWPNSAENFQNEFDIIILEDDEACYILGLPDGLTRNDKIRIHEQTQPHYAVLIASERGRYVCTRKADYPVNPPDTIFKHESAHILVKRTSDDWFSPHLFGFYLKKEPFLKDYEGGNTNPYIEERDIDGNHKSIQLN